MSVPKWQESARFHAGFVAVVVAGGLAIEGLGRPGIAPWSLVFFASAAVWSKLHLAHRAAKRDQLARLTFGMGEGEARALLGLREDQVAQVLEDPRAREALLEATRMTVARLAAIERKTDR